MRCHDAANHDSLGEIWNLTPVGNLADDAVGGSLYGWVARAVDATLADAWVGSHRHENEQVLVTLWRNARVGDAWRTNVKRGRVWHLALAVGLVEHLVKVLGPVIGINQSVVVKLRQTPLYTQEQQHGRRAGNLVLPPLLRQGLVLWFEQLRLDVVQVSITNHYIGRVEHVAHHDAGDVTGLGFDLGHLRVGVNHRSVLFGQTLDGFDDLVETAHRVENANVHVYVGHQVVHARGVIRGCSQEHCRKVQDLLQTLVAHVTSGKL